MADNVTVRGAEQPAPVVGTDGSAKKSKLEQQVERLAERIKHRTGRTADDDVLRAMVLRKQARAERAEQTEHHEKEYRKTIASETLQAKQTEDKGAIIGRAREMNTADGLNRHQRQLVTSDPHAPTILPPATHAPINAEAATNVLEKIFGFLKPASAEAAPLTIESYAETLVPRAPTQPRETNLRDGGQRGEGHLEQGHLEQAHLDEGQLDQGHLGEHLGQHTRGLRAEERPQRPLPEGTGEHREPGELPTDRPTTGQPVVTDPHDQHPQRPVDEHGRPVTPTTPDEPAGHLPAKHTIHLPKKREPPQVHVVPTHSGSTPLGRTVSNKTKSNDASRQTPLGQTVAHATGEPPSGPGQSTGPRVSTGPRPGGGGTVGAPMGGRIGRALRPGPRPMADETSNTGPALSLRPRGSRKLRASDVTTDPTWGNTGGGFDTTTSWDGMHFNWEAFFVKFIFKYQKDENEARRLMKELRDAMHKLAQEGIKAKIAIEKMNQAFERAEKAFELGFALKGVMEAAQQSAQQGQQQGQGQNQGQPGANPTGAGRSPGASPTAGAAVAPGAGGPSPAGGADRLPGEGDARTPAGRQPAGQQQQGQDQQGSGDKNPMSGGSMVGGVAEHLRRDLEKITAELISSAQRGGSEMDARIRSTYMQAQGLYNQLVQILAMSRSK